MVLGLRQAEGDFRLPDPRPDRILLISGGSGITPVMSMLRTLCAEGHRGPITFLHYAPDPEHAIYRDAARAARRGPSQPASGPLLHPRHRRRRGRRTLQPLPARGRRAAPRRGRDLRVRPPGSARVHQAGVARPRVSTPGSTRRASSRRAWRRRAASRRARSTSRAPGCGSQNSGATLLEQAERGGARPRNSAAGWASATPAPAERPRGGSRTSPPARSPPATTRRSRSAYRRRSATSSSTSENRLPTRRDQMSTTTAIPEPARRRRGRRRQHRQDPAHRRSSSTPSAPSSTRSASA